jgi:UDP-N-acetylmuramyl pentapeptide synthase
VESFGAGGQWFPDTQALSAALIASSNSGVRMLVKGSRVNRLEHVVEALTAAPARQRPE